MLQFSGLSPTQLLVVEMVVVFITLGLFLSWVSVSIFKLRRSNHDIRNKLHAIGMMMEHQHGRSPFEPRQGGGHAGHER